MNSEGKTVEYKKKPYKVLYRGVTKYGDRAHLAFLDGSRDFWVDGALVTETSQSDSAEENPNRSSCPDVALAEQLIDAGFGALAGKGGDLQKLARLNLAAAWLRRQLKNVREPRRSEAEEESPGRDPDKYEPTNEDVPF